MRNHLLRLLLSITCLLLFSECLDLAVPEKTKLPVDGANIDAVVASDKDVKSVDKVEEVQRVRFVHAFLASLSVILVSEIGDKTFFIAAIMAMRHPRTTIFAGAISALATMTVMSAVMGFATNVVPRWFTYYVSTFLFFIFGLRMLKEGYYMSANEGQEEYDEVQEELKKKDTELEDESPGDIETGSSRIHITRTRSRRFLFAFFSQIFLQAFTMTFLAEWGDRSQITTIILGAREDVYGVIVGGVLGHAICTGVAVIGGRFIAQMISVRTVTLIGGVVFLIFAASALFIHPAN